MRDRINASALTDLTALLQRDLNDRRVARELIPYLLGSNRHVQSKVGFFPAVLAVLIPAGYLEQGPDADETIAYPAPLEDPEGPFVNYQRAGVQTSAWQLERYEIDGMVQPVGLLRVNPHLSEIVVLDGQHRTNAFRYLSGAFDPSNDIYAEFYRDIERPAELDADLPVTIMWFESENQARIQPRLISRQLFVDVNNSAHSVSLARTILLDDRSVSAIATQAFYNLAAVEGFRADSFSLLHSAFDMDSDLADAALPAFALTSPEIAEAAFLWLLLGSGRYTLRAWRVDRLRAQRNRNQFVQLVGTSENVNFGSDDDENSVQVAGPEFAEEYRRLMTERVTPVLWTLMSGLSLLSAHYQAAGAIQRWVEEEADTTEREAWAKIFTGGEGLYWTFTDRRRVSERNIYRQASVKIERRFREERGRALNCEPAEADAAFKSFATKAFQVGFVMAAFYLAERGRGGGDIIQATEDLLARLNPYSPENWMVFFRELRPLVIKGDTAPKVWPSYRNLLLRMYDENRRELMTQPEDLPEVHAFSLALETTAGRIREENEELPEPVQVLRIVSGERDRISGVFGRAGLNSQWFNSESALEFGRAIFETKFQDLA
ncbi:MAG: hypothetical protein QOH47_2517 [Sphingomonadales bacterium]|jgi:hypothetical protein|nr:hypothetical protein [Sphingomonadales bacterium]